MATKTSVTTMAGKRSTFMQAEVMETQREIIDDWDTDEVLGSSPENDKDEDEVGSDIEELDEDDSDEDDSDEDDSDEDDSDED